jgi:multidrug efflux pump
MLSHFFINRPIFAWVIAIVIMLAGLLAIKTLPISQYPAIAPPEIAINAIYPGASAKTVEDTVTQVIEQKMNGIDHLRYMSSSSDSAGHVTVTLTFDAGTDPNIAQVQVQNKLQLATPLLPKIVQQQGLQVAKSTRSFLMIIALYSENHNITREDLTDYMVAYIQDHVSRIEGVGEVQTFGAQYAMRIWLDPDKLNSFSMMPSDVAQAIRTYNVQVSAGQFGGSPFVPGQQLNATITSKELLQTPEQFGEILLRTNSDGSTVHLRDVARIEIGSENYEAVACFNGNPTGGMAIKLASGANALDTADRVKKRIAELSVFFPQGMKAVYPYDTTPFVRISIEEVVKTLLEAILLVFLVMYLFLQNFRATLIPTIAVPVVLLGTFGVLSACGFSINTLTMFAMVLAIGLLVDDAIVVVENVERVMSEEGLSPKEATRKSMKQITGALIGIAMVLSAVFVPMAFFGGSTGVIYRQFSITIVSSMALSVVVALVLTPALCATMLKPVVKGHEAGEGSWFSGFFHGFNRIYGWSSRRYQSMVGRILVTGVRYLAIYALIGVAMGYLFMRLPTAYLPDEDQGVLLNLVQLPVGASQERTVKVLEQLQHHYLVDEKEAVECFFYVAGFSFAGRGQNNGLAFTKLKDWDQRKRPDLQVKAVAGRAMAAFSQIRDGMAFAFPPPAVMEMGTANGFDFELQDRGGLGHDKLMEARGMLLGMAAQDKRVMAVRPNGQNDTPEFKIDIDEKRAGALGVSLNDINDTISSAWGGAYVNDFVDRGRTKKVYIQGDAKHRMQPKDLDKWYVRNKVGDMVPFSAFASGHWIYGSPRLERYNGMPSAQVQGQPAPGVSSGDAMKAMEEMAAKLPPGIGYEWTGLSYQERMAGSQAPALYALSILVVFLCLAALYESWAIPFSVMLVIPLGVIGALVATSSRGLVNDVYFQVGLLTIIGLSAKNAILIVEFAKERMDHGAGLMEATMEAARLRLRPILMTSLAFILGVLPLALNKGAGSGAQNSIGTGVIGGMLTATFLAIFYIPLFFVVIRRIFPAKPADEAPPATSPGGPKLGSMAPLLAIGLATSLAMTGCQAGPEFHLQPPPVGDAFANGTAPGVNAEATETAWWHGFNEPKLEAMIGQALEANRDLRIATARVKEARALYKTARLDFYPTVTADGGYTHGLSSQVERPGFDRANRDYNLYDAGFDATWELDLFGRVHRSTEAGSATLAAVEANRRDVTVSLIAEIARNYVELRGSQARLAMARRNAEIQRSTLVLTMAKSKAGQITDLEVARSQTQLNATLSLIPSLEAASQRAIHRLGILTGQAPTAQAAALNTAAALPALPAQIKIGNPADLLRRRSDIQAAERSLAAATARIGMQTADLFPRVTFNGSLGVKADDLAGLGKPGADTYSFGPRISWAAFDLGRVRARIQAADAQAEASLAIYEKTVLTALEETENALVDFGREQVRRDYLTAAAVTADQAVRLANARYENGVTDFQAVLDTQAKQLDIQDQLAVSQTRVVTSLIAVYKALGGGWESAMPIPEKKAVAVPEKKATAVPEKTAVTIRTRP